MAALRASSLAPSGGRSTPSRAGRSRPSGGSSRWSASTGKRCSTTTFYASCTTTSNRTDGSWSGSMTEPGSEAPVGRVSGLVRDLDERSACVQVDAMVGAEPGSMAVGDRYEHRADERGRTFVDRSLRLWVQQNKELGPVIPVGKSIPAIDSQNDRMALRIRTDHTRSRARPVEPRHPCVVDQAVEIDLVGLDLDAPERIRVGRVYGTDPESAVAGAGLNVDQLSERVNGPRVGIHQRNADAHLVIRVEI